MDRSPTKLCAALALGLAVAAPVSAETPVRILLETPQPDEVVRNDLHQAPLRGMALAYGERPVEYDILLVIDLSGSTRRPSGVDVDGDGAIGPADTILAAEIRAADALLETLPRGGRIRVGVITFSGEMDPETGRRARWDQQDAWLEVPLTSDFHAVRARLPKILARGPFGGTNFAAGISLAITELTGLTGARSRPRPSAQKFVLFLTDGTPTFPVGLGSESDRGDVDAALAAARLARRAGIAVHTYALGPNALNNPIAATEIARITDGTFLGVQNPGDIVSFLQATTLADVEDVVFTNLTTREVSTDVRLAPDGSFSGFVPVREGTNDVRITALTSDGASASVEVSLEFENSALAGRDLALEIERIRERNKQLMLVVDRDRVRRFREHQRKQLELQPVEE